MLGYLLEDMHGGKYCFSIARPPSGGKSVELPEHIAECFKNKEYGLIKLNGCTYKRPLHCIFTDENYNIIEKSYIIN